MSRISVRVKSLTGGGANIRQFTMILALIALIALFQVLTHGLTLSSTNLIALVSQYSYILILAIGMVMVIIAGHIDLSVGSVAAFTGIVVAKAMSEFHLAWPLAILLGLVVGLVIGAWQGFWVAYVGVPAFIVTLAGMMLFRGGNQFVGNSTSLQVPKGFWVIGAGFLPEVGPNTNFNNLTLLLGLGIAAVVIVRQIRARRTSIQMDSRVSPVWVSVLWAAVLVGVVVFATLRFAGGPQGTSYPVSGIILGVLVVLYSFITRNTSTGRHIYAVGGNSRAAALSGVKLRKINFLVIMNMGMLAALAGMIFVARSNASGPQDGNGWELDAIASVFIGGAAVTGGVGTVAGSIVGGLFMAVLNNGLALMSVGSDRVQMIKGLVLLIAVAFDVYNKTQGRPSIIGLLTRGFRGSGSDHGAGTKSGSPSDAVTKPGPELTKTSSTA
jgi:putative multiple sugar transport system permease protein